jgi:hypothetical protein
MESKMNEKQILEKMNKIQAEISEVYANLTLSKFEQAASVEALEKKISSLYRKLCKMRA